MNLGPTEGSCSMAVPAMSTRPKTSALRMPSAHPALRNANHSSVKGTVVESMCVDWRKALRSLCHVDPRTHCDLITAVSNQIPLILSLEKNY